MVYVDGFLLPVSTDKVEAYRKMSEAAGKIWMEHGALAYKECVGEDLTPAMPEGVTMVPFTQSAGTKDGETVIFSFIIYKDRQHRDEVNSKVMADPRIHESCVEDVFDCQRMAFGGFQSIVDL